MNKDQINEKALQSLHRYFKNAVDIHKGTTPEKDMTKEQITSSVKQQVEDEEKSLEKRLADIKVLKENIDKKVEDEYATIWGAKKDSPEYHKPTVDEFEKLMKNRENEIIAAVQEKINKQ